MEPSPEYAARHDRFVKDRDFFEQHHQRLLDEGHHGEFAAVFGEQIVGIEKDLENLVNRLRAEGYEPGHMVIQRVITNQERREALAVMRSMVFHPRPGGQAS